jgi:hypothetical protein
VVSEKAVRQAIYQKLNVASVTSLLTNGSAGIVNEEAGPGQATFPLCVFWKVSGVTVNRFGGEAYRDQLWGVKGIVQSNSASTAEDIDKAVYDLLNFGTLTITGGNAMSVIRESDVSYSESHDDKVYKHRGGVYRLKVQATS